MASNATIGSLRVVLGLDSANFEQGIKRSQSQASGFERGLGKALQGAGGHIDNLAGRAGTLGSALGEIGVAGLAAGVGLGAMVASLAGAREAMRFADGISDTAAKLAVSTDALQEYRYAVHALGGDYEDADKALQGFKVAFGAAHAELSKKAVKPFKALGLDPQDFKNTEDALAAVIDKISALKSTDEQAAIADKLGLSDILPALREGAGRFDELREKARALGIVMDTDLVQRAGDANDKFEDLSQVIDVQLKSALVDLAPVLTGLLGIVADLAKGFEGIVDSFREIEHKTTSGLQDRRAQLTGEISRTGTRALTGVKLTQGEKDRIASANDQISQIDAELAARAARGKPIAASGTSLAHVSTGSGADKAGAVRLASAAAIDSATKAEFDARQALIGDIQKLADMKAHEVDTETAAANARLQEEAAQGKITQAAAATAIALNNRAASERKALIARDAAAQVEQHQLELQRQIASYQEQAARNQAELATTAAARNAIERATLTAGQDLDRRELKSRLDAQVARGEISQASRDEVVAAQAKAQTTEREVADREALGRLQAEANAAAEAEIQAQIDLLASQQDVAQSAYERGKIGLKILDLEQRLERLKLQEIIHSATASDAEKNIARARLEQLTVLQANAKTAAERGVVLVDALKDAAGAASDMASALRRGDLGGAVSAAARALQELSGLAGSSTSLGAKLGKLGQIAGTIGTSISIGQTVTSMFGQKQTPGGTIGGGLGAVAGYILGGPIGSAIGATIGNAIGNLFKGGKESNHGALATINGDSYGLSGDKRTDQTSQLATSAAQAVLNGQAALKAAGIKLAASVKTIDIGTRDATDIILSDGRHLTSAVGDAAAAAEVSLKALLQGATFADDAQKKLVDSMVAAGAGFDQIAASLQRYADAQALPQQVADAIQQLADPNGFAVTQLKRDQEARRKSIQEALDAGNLTADQFASLNVQLGKLEGLELDDVMRRFAGSMNAATSAASSAVEDARSALAEAVARETSEIEARRDQFKALGESLLGFRKSLDVSADVPAGQRFGALSAELDRIGGLAKLGNVEALGSLQGVSEQFILAARDNAGSQEEFARAQGKVKAITEQAAGTALRQADIAQSQLSALNAAVAGLIEINTSVLTVADGIANLMSALGAFGKASGQNLGLNPSANAALVAATGFKGDFGSGGFQAWIVNQDDATKAAARKILLAFGQPERISGFKTGGSFTVGGFGGADSQAFGDLRLSPGEMVDIRKPGQVSDTAAAIRALDANLANANRAIAANTLATAKLLSRWDGDGQPPERSVA